MFKRIRSLGNKNSRSKYRFDVAVLTLEGIAGLPDTAAACRVVWSRGNKVQVTRLSSVKDGEPELEVCVCSVTRGLVPFCLLSIRTLRVLIHFSATLSLEIAVMLLCHNLSLFLKIHLLNAVDMVCLDGRP